MDDIKIHLNKILLFNNRGFQFLLPHPVVYLFSYSHAMRLICSWPVRFRYDSLLDLSLKTHRKKLTSLSEPKSIKAPNSNPKLE